MSHPPHNNSPTQWEEEDDEDGLQGMDPEERRISLNQEQAEEEEAGAAADHAAEVGARPSRRRGRADAEEGKEEGEAPQQKRGAYALRSRK
jgi:hypothetical protein